jgi:hypothetical protein
MLIIIGSLVVMALVAIFARSGHRDRQMKPPPRKPVGHAPFVDYSDFDQDRILRNRSDNWDA